MAKQDGKLESAALGGSAAGPATALLVHGHPVVKSFFHTMRARPTLSPSSPDEPAKKEQQEQQEQSANKRRRSTIDDGTTSEDSAGAADRAEKELHPAKKKVHKHSYVVQREQKQALEAEIRELEAHAKQLRDAAGITDMSNAVATFTALYEAVDQQRLHLAVSRSVLSDYERRQAQSPLHSFLHMPREWPQRQQLLRSLRDEKLRVARAFLAARSQSLNASPTAMMDQTSFAMPNGDRCGVRFDVTPFRGVRSAQQVVDALLFYFIHLEISLSEQTGSTAIREDDEGSSVDPGILHHRLQIVMPDGLVVEKSSALFVDRATESEDGEAVFIVGDFVDEDDLFPYQPHDRVRKDISTVLRIATTSQEGGEPVVTMTKWQFLKLHAARELQSRPPLSEYEMGALHVNHMRGLDAMVATMRQFLYGSCANAK